MKPITLAVLAVFGLAETAAAQDGLYYGIGLGVGSSMTTSPEVTSFDAKATDYSLALTLGYRFAASGPLTFGIEGNLDLLSGKNMADGGLPSCAGTSPSWCEVESAFRLRGTMTNEMTGGSHLTTSLGVVVMQGRTENGGGNYLDTTGRGVSVGLAWQKDGMPIRIDLNYDAIRDDNQTAYERELNLVGLRVSYMF